MIKQTNKNVTSTGVHARVRCTNEDCKHLQQNTKTKKWYDTSVFSEGMYLLTAPIDNVDSKKTEIELKKKVLESTKFTLWVTDKNGLLIPMQSENYDAREEDNIGTEAVNNNNGPRPKFNSLQVYAVYIIVHFDQALARKCLKLINDSDTDPIEEFGLPIFVAPNSITACGKGLHRECITGWKYKKKHKCYIKSKNKCPKGLFEFQINNHKTGFITANKTAHNYLEDEIDNYIAGHKNYNHQIIFENMPNANCKWIKNNIFKLQLHLGHMRYPVGGIYTPYHPCNRMGKSKGIFDKKVYNGILKFSRDAAKGNGVRLNQRTYLFKSMFKNDQLAPAQDLAEYSYWKRHISFQPSFTRKFEDVDKDDNPNKAENLTKFKTKWHKKEKIPLVFVDKTIGEAINQWISNGYRKSGNVLVSNTYRFEDLGENRLKGHELIWMRNDFSSAVNAWNKDIKVMLNHGKKKATGLYAGSTYRDAYFLSLKPGVLQSSLHKAGLALDLLEKDLTDSRKSFPVIFQIEASHYPRYNKELRSRFRLFLECKDHVDKNDKARLDTEKKFIDRLVKYRIEKSGANKEKYSHSNYYHNESYKSRWGLISKKGKPIEETARNSIKLYHDKVHQWKYLPDRKSGGIPEEFMPAETKRSKFKFIDITSIAESHQIEGINAHKKKWRAMLRTIDFKQTLESFTTSSKILRNLYRIKPAKHNNSIIREEKINFSFENERKITLLKYMNASDSKHTNYTGNGKCYFCKEPISKGSTVRMAALHFVAHESCFQHQNHKFPYKSFSKETQLASVDELNPALLYQWGMYVKKWSKKAAIKNRRRRNKIPLNTIPEISLSFPELLSFHDQVVSKNETLKQAKYLVSFEKNSHSNVVTTILEGSEILNHIEQNSSWKISFRPNYSNLTEESLKNSKNDTFSNLPKKDITIFTNWNKAINDWNKTSDINTKIEIDTNSFISLNPGPILLTFLNFLSQNKKTNGIDIICTINDNPLGMNHISSNSEFIILPKKYYSTIYDRFIRYANGWRCHITPILGNEKNPEFIDKCKIYIPIKGQPRPMEWWHFQYDKVAYENGKRQSWLKLMEDIGWTKEALKYIGYSKKDFK